MRMVGCDLINVMKFKCKISDSEVGIRYRFPTTEERIAYDAESIRVEGNAIISVFAPAQLKYGRKLIVGVEPGSFYDEDGPISSDEKRDDYRSNWYDLVVNSGCVDDIAKKLASQVFQFSIEPQQIAKKNSKETSRISGENDAAKKKNLPA